MTKTMTKPWLVVQNAGYTNEKIVHEAATYDDAWCAYQELYSWQEREELHVDIMKRLPDGTLTTEF